ncbi:hypothetical protein QTJ16_001571 [Diplocarpon rosae]|uniref:MAU2 chromatid cohesion factor homolog n=1 Tax=Diplocarpon rosae TaxID=946125 RepID=A0AAD9T416_9HELO|nr:hypothetical protein QTJ16_001571 [Diplocarpon rosae]PBP16754.1 hypothetical protein BUE80_DR012584 [Diplocarpon rosae]
MSYQGGNPGNGWAGHPNAYAQDPRQQRNFVPNGSQSQYPSLSTAPVNHGQYWSQNLQTYGVNHNYANNSYYASPPALPPVQHFHHQRSYQAQPQPQHAPQPQYISPAQLLHQQPQTTICQQYQRPVEAITCRSILEPTVNNYPGTSSSSSVFDPEANTAKLLVALAEEYFEAAHEFAPSVAASMAETDVRAYEKLIATGLGCLDTALKNVRLPPRLEANIILRYACVLYDETENSMEAETVLSKGIALCERNHYDDLKYAMQFSLAQWIGKKNPKASMKALEGHANEAKAYQHFSWVYVFRFLRAAHAIKSGNLLDYHIAVSNLRAVGALAEERGDHAIFLTASLMEAITYMRTTGPEAIEHIQRAIASAWKYQEERKCQIPQLVGLAHILAVACSIRQGHSLDMLGKLKKMQSSMDNFLKNPEWGTDSNSIAVPITRTRVSSHVVSRDTRMILGIGEDGGDNLMMCFLNKKDAYSITYLLSGMVLLHRNSSDQKGFKYLKAGLEMLEGKMDGRSVQKSQGLLPDMIAQRQWRGLLLCYFRVYIAFCSAGAGDWLETKRYIDQLKTTAQRFDIPLTGTLDHMAVYLTGLYYQGIGELDSALKVFQGDRFCLSTAKSNSATLTDQIQRDLSILAALNILWILQDIPRQDLSRNVSLIERLRPFCEGHPNKDIQTAFNLILATVPTNPPTPVFVIKDYLRKALDGAKDTANTQFLCITLNVMCSKFFANVVGDQAEKSAMAASTQASNSGNVLWKSVADGMLARCYQVQGKTELAQRTLEEAQINAQKASQGSPSSNRF